MSRSWCSPADSGLRKKSAVVVKRSESVVAERGMTPWDRVEDKKIKKKKRPHDSPLCQHQVLKVFRKQIQVNRIGKIRAGRETGEGLL